MASDDLAPEVRSFIDEHIRSVSQLEMLLLLQTTADQNWTVAELARELRVEAAWVEAQLNGFAAAGLVSKSAETPAAYRFNPATPELRRAMLALSRAYLLQRVRVIERVYGRSSDRIQAFADAFRLKKERPDG